MRSVYLYNLNMAMLSGDFRAILESGCHCAVLADRHLVDYSKPQLFVKLGDGERDSRYLLNGIVELDDTYRQNQERRQKSLRNHEK